MLIVFSGLPGVGKTTLSRKIAEHLKATYLRVDTIEYAISNVKEPFGYYAAYGIAKDNLALGQNVVADCVNPCVESREGWHQVAEACNVSKVDIEIICSDEGEHQKRVNERVSDIDGLKSVTWQEVQTLEYVPHKESIIIDTAGRAVKDCFDELLKKISPSE